MLFLPHQGSRQGCETTQNELTFCISIQHYFPSASIFIIPPNNKKLPQQGHHIPIFPFPIFNPISIPPCPIHLNQYLMFHKDQKFSYFDYEELTKDFCYNKPLSLHFQTQNKQTAFSFDELIEVRSGKCFLADSFKLRHRIAGNKLLKTAWGLNSMKVYYGYEIKEEDGASSVMYSRLQSDRKLQNASVQFGLERKSSQLQFDANVTTFLYQRQNQYFLYGRLIYHGHKFNLGLLSVFDYSTKNLQTNNVVLQLKPHDKHQIFLRGEVDGLRNYSLKYSKLSNYFDYFLLNYITKPTETLTLMAEVKYDFNAKKVKNIQSVIEKKFQSKKLKVGVNQNADVVFQMRFPFGVGLQSNFDFGLELADILKSRKISYGFRVNINP